MSTTTVTIPKPLRVRLAALANARGKSQPALIEDMVAKAEDEQFWSALTGVTPQSYRNATTDGDALSEDYSTENESIATQESGAAW